MPGYIGGFAELNANPLVMEFFPRPWSLGESHAAFDRAQSEFTERGFGVYAPETHAEFFGIVGISVPSFEAHFTPV
jgi:ribosomal-protein-alanine N-acetyltransferase